MAYARFRVSGMRDVVRCEPRVERPLDFPAAGRYRLFLRFVHGGRERTAGFTVEVGR